MRLTAIALILALCACSGGGSSAPAAQSLPPPITNVTVQSVAGNYTVSASGTGIPPQWLPVRLTITPGGDLTMWLPDGTYENCAVRMASGSRTAVQSSPMDGDMGATPVMGAVSIIFDQGGGSPYFTASFSAPPGERPPMAGGPMVRSGNG